MSEFDEYKDKILGKMSSTAHLYDVQRARTGNFRKLGCFDHFVQEEFPTDVAIAGSILFFGVESKGGVYMCLQQWADSGQTDKKVEVHSPCGLMLLGMGIATWAGQETEIKALEKLTAKFNKDNRTNFGVVVHRDLGSARNFLK